MDKSKSIDINVFSYNCNGFNGCIDEVISELEKNSSIAFICEHWLQPYELSNITELLNGYGLTTYLKSSIDPEEHLVGRPYGGIGFIYRKKTGLNFKCVDIDNERICWLKVLKGGKVLLNIIGVYMPYLNGTVEQIGLYSETIDKLQAIIDECNGTPIMIVGDMNASLPQSNELSRNWHKQHPFTSHSLLLYDFICDNDLYVSNFQFSQMCNYTYEKGGHRSYIDHVIMSQYMANCVSDCKIVFDDLQTSDHLPIRTNVELEVEIDVHVGSCKSDGSSNDAVRVCPIVNWDNRDVSKKYSELMEKALKAESFHYLDGITKVDEAQVMVDRGCAVLTDAIHRCSQAVSSRPPKSYSGGRGRQVHWWTSDCTQARDRCRFWRKLWILNNRIRCGYVYQIYKSTKKVYRNVRRSTIKHQLYSKFHVMSKLFKQGNSKKFWNQIRASKDRFVNCGEISLHHLKKHFTEKFQEDLGQRPDHIRDTNYTIIEWYKSMQHRVITSPHFGPMRISRLIDKLKKGRSAGYDGILAEHLQNAKSAILIDVLCKIFNTCAKLGVVPNSFKTSLLIPILKKPTLNPAEAVNYRPIMVSSVLSKIMEYAMLDDASSHVFHDLQYGFVEGRGTKMAITTTQDVITYCNSRGSAVFACALDAERAFDGVPSCVLLYKAMDVLADIWWRLLYVWYEKANAVIKYMGKYSTPIWIEKGTRQGGLTSPFLFNLIYQEMIQELSECSSGICVGKTSYNVFCYADDILLLSLSVTGLQKLMDVANKYVINHGLSFNAKKSSCSVFGKHYLESEPQWYLNGCKVENSDEVNYLGAILSNSSSKHIENRIAKCRRAFYSLQGAGMCENGVEPKVKSYLWRTALQPILSYGNDCLNIQRTDLFKMEKLQAKLIKASLGLSKYMRTTPLIRALDIRSLINISTTNRFKLYNSIMMNGSRSAKFYTHLLRKNCKYTSLVSHVTDVCSTNGFSRLGLLVNDEYFISCIKKLKYSGVNDGLVDSCKMLLVNYSHRDKGMLKLLLMPRF